MARLRHERCDESPDRRSVGQALVIWLWTAQSFVAGIPLDAVTWLGFGLVATLPVDE